MVVHGSPVDNPIPDLSDEQYRALREFTVQHLQEDTCSTTPIRLARVLSRKKPATLILTPPEISSSEEYLVDLLDRINCPYRTFTGLSGWVVSSTSGRLDLLPTSKTLCDAYHRRLGVVFGYPRDAVDHFINKDSSHPTTFDIAQSDAYDAKEVAYTKFVCYAHPKTPPETFEYYLSVGRENRQRIAQLAQVWNMPELDELANEIYTEAVEDFKKGEMPSTSNLTVKFDWSEGQQISGYSRN